MCSARHGCRAFVVLALSIASASFPYAGEIASRRPACTGEPSRDTIRRIGRDGDLELVSGRTARLADIRLDAMNAGRAESVLHGFVTEVVSVTTIGSADRWGRVPANVALGDRGGAIDLAELLVAEGLALVDPGERDGLCRPELLAMEAAARAAARGLWRGQHVLQASEPNDLRARTDRFVIIEGTIRSVGERRDRTYLNFGRDFARDFAVSVPRRNWDAFKAAGRDAAALKGRRVRVRGLLEVRRAPGMEIRSPDVLEYLDERPPPQ